ncbi:Fc.00g026850.m01.CDS01 [Cosmosporella sp. VM-42]
MLPKLLIGSLLFVTKVLAGGYAGALERVWLFYAYQIDGLNDASARTLGWKCKSWDDAAKQCRVKKGKEQWVQCKGSLPGPDGKRCTFSELLNCLGGAGLKDKLVADKDGNLLDLGNTNPDPEETAKRVYAHYLASPTGYVPDYQSHRILRTATGDYMDCINKVGDLVANAGAAGKNTGDNKKLFERFLETTTLIKTARVGDHGKWLIDAAEKDLNPQGIDVEKENVGSGHNPADASKTWQTVDWEKTMSNRGDRSELEMLLITGETREKFYDNDKKASDHRVVMQSFEIVENKARGCT